MYQALYRKYRPNKFADVVGQDVIIKTLKNSISSNKITHAYLFTGPRGTGKTSVAKIFAKTINCYEIKDGEACNVCVNCTQILNHQNIDIIEIDAASNNGVDEIREIRNKVSLVPSIGKYKIYIIDEVHMLTVGAFNALLKTLEEPPAHIIFILATTEPHKIPTTILSRCQRFDFKKINEQKIYEKLKQIVEEEKITITDQAISEIARISDGGLRDAISILDQVIAYSINKIDIDDVHAINGTITKQDLSEFIEKIVNKDKETIFKLIEKYDYDGKNLIKLADEMVFFFKNILLYKISPELLKEEKELYDKFKDILSEEEIEKIISIIIETISTLKGYNDSRLIFEIVIIKILGINSKLKKEKNKETVDIVKTESNILKEKQKDIDKKAKILEEKRVKQESKNIYDEETKNKIEKIKQLRVNNTLSNFSKQETIILKKKLQDIHEYILNPDYNKVAGIVMDGELKAASSDRIIFVYKTKTLVDIFIYYIKSIQEMLEKLYDKKYIIIAVDTSDWEIIKNRFNNKKEKYDYIEYNDNLTEILEATKEKSKNEIEKIFDNIIEYN